MAKRIIEWVGELPEKEALPEQSPIEKVAQRRSMLQWLHEKSNVPRIAAEAFSDSYQNQMKVLRQVDTSIRYTARGLENYLKLAKKALKQRKYLDVIHFVGNINDDLKMMFNERKALKDMMGEHLDEFYGDHEHADLEREYFKKEAGLMDMFSGLVRPKAGKMFEKSYKALLNERVKAMNELYNETERLVYITMDALKDLGTYRAKGEIGDYIKSLNELARKREVFENKFKTIYDMYILPLVNRIKEEREVKNKMWWDEENVPEETAAEIPFEKAPFESVFPNAAKTPTPVPDLIVPERAKSVDAPKEPEPSEAPKAIEPVKTPIQVVQKQQAKPKTNKPRPVRTMKNPGTPATVMAPKAEETFQSPNPERFKSLFEKQPIDPRQTGIMMEEGKPTRRYTPGVFSDKIIVDMIKTAKDQGKSDKFISEMLITYSEALDESGDIDGSIKLMAMAEGMLDVV